VFFLSGRNTGSVKIPAYKVKHTFMCRASIETETLPHNEARPFIALRAKLFGHGLQRRPEEYSGELKK
jgi:hypothetical protein